MPVAAAPSQADSRSVLRAALGKLSAPIAATALVKKHLQGPYKRLSATDAQQLLELEVTEGLAYRYPPNGGKSKEPRYWTINLESLAAERIRAALTEQPQSLAQLKKRVGAELQKTALSAKAWDELLARLCAAGQAFKSGTPKSPKYSTQDPHAAAISLLLEALSGGPLTLAELKKQTKSLTEPQRKPALERLVASGKLYLLPPQGKVKSARYSTQPLNARTFIAEALEKLLETLAKPLAAAGVSRAELAATASDLCLAWEPTALRPTNTPSAESGPAAADAPSMQALLDEALLQTIYDRITMIEPAAPIGALVSLRELRRALDFQNLSKAEFDRAVLALADSQRVLLHAHDFPASLPPADRAAMVEDEQGHVYIGVMLNS